MRRFIFASALSLQLLTFGQANGQSLTIPPLTIPPNSPIRCDPLHCMAPGHQRPKPLYAADPRCVFYVDRNLAGRRFYAGAVVRLSETKERALLENTFLSLGPDNENVFSAVRCDDSLDARCHALLFADPELKGRQIEIVGSQGVVDLAALGFDNQVSSATITCDVRKTPT